MSGAGDRHDRELGAFLRELPVPEHRPDFFERLEAQLGRDAPARGRVALPRGRVALILAAVAGAVALVVALALAPSRSSAPGEARAAELKAAVRQAFASLRTLHGTLVYRSFHPNPVIGRIRTQRWSFWLTSAGDLRLDALGRPNAIAYDARTGTERALAESASLGRGAFPVERRGVAPGAPDRGPSDQLLERGLGAAVQTLVAAGKLHVRDATYRGRDVRRAVVPLGGDGGRSGGDRLEIDIDRETSLPVHVRLSSGARTLNELRISDLSVNPSLPRSTFRLPLPRRGTGRIDEGFRRMRLERVASSVGYRPLVPEWVPRGFRLAEVAVAARAARTGRGPRLNPPSRMVVSLAYRRGFDRLIVTTRRRGSGVTWRDPFGGLDPGSPAQRVPVRTGALRGADVHVVTGPLALPHLWALGDELVVTVSGNLRRSELVRTAASLRPR